MAQRALSKRRLDNLFLYHLVVSTAIGIFTFLAPHSLAVVFAGEGHALHEFVRLYGASLCCPAAALVSRRADMVLSLSTVLPLSPALLPFPALLLPPPLPPRRRPVPRPVLAGVEDKIRV